MNIPPSVLIHYRDDSEYTKYDKYIIFGKEEWARYYLSGDGNDIIASSTNLEDLQLFVKILYAKKINNIFNL